MINKKQKLIISTITPHLQLRLRQRLLPADEGGRGGAPPAGGGSPPHPVHRHRGRNSRWSAILVDA